jgi:type I restriction enzyme S subunit
MDAAVAAAKNDSAVKGPWVLPEGWCWVPLGELGTWTGGGTPSKANLSFWTNGDVPWVSPKDMKVAVIGDTEDKVTAEAVEGSSAKYVAQGSVLMVMRSGILKHSFPVAITDRIVTLNQDLRALTPHSGVCPKFVALYLALAANRVLHDCSKDGTTVDSIEVAALERLLIPLGPVAEQRRIVARVDALFAEITEGEAALAAVRKGLDTFRRALLKAAVTGELTRDWRQEQKELHASAETGQDLLIRIAKDRAAKAPKGRARRSGGSVFSTCTLPELPGGWAWTTLEEIGDPTRSSSYGVLQPGPHVADGIPMVRVQDINFGTVALDEIKRISHAIERRYKRTRLQGGELLITLVGSIGRTAVASLELKGANTARAVGVVPLSSAVDAKWVELWLRSPAKQNELVSQAHEVARKTLNLEDVRRATVALPPPAESAEILRRVSDALAANADALLVLDAEAADAARLKQSILKAAFEGRLVAQDPADEPASTLLARVATGPLAVRSKRGQSRKSNA